MRSSRMRTTRFSGRLWGVGVGVKVSARGGVVDTHSEQTPPAQMHPGIHTSWETPPFPPGQKERHKPVKNITYPQLLLRAINMKKNRSHSTASSVFIDVFLPPATKLGQGYVFIRVCDSVHRGVSASVHAGIHPPSGTETDTPAQ